MPNGVGRAAMAFALAGWCFVAGAAAAEAVVHKERSPDGPDYSTEVRPILAQRCFACHGPDEAARQGGFRLDLRDSATAPADSGETPVAPGDPGKSEILQRLAAEDASLRMPPLETHKSVTAEEIELLSRWIAAGAPWGGHWAFEPLRTTASGGSIDGFIQSELDKHALALSPLADRQTLIRRVSLGLTGLPPTTEQVRAFCADERSDAYPRLVRRLLRSDAYGEHMARYWLDAARYADTHGLNLDNYREMWLYRDWVVDAFRTNMPYDRFVTEQVAGDLLPDPSDDQLIATGFNRCHVTTGEGGSIEEEVRARNEADRVDTFGTVFLGLTFGCARCHDHKYDPITAKDYYALGAFFNSFDGPAMDSNDKAPGPVVRRPPPEQLARQAVLERRCAELDAKLSGAWAEVDEAQAVWEASVRAALANRKGEAALGGRVRLGQWQLASGFYKVDKGLSQVNRENFVTRFPPEAAPVNLEQTYPTNFGLDIAWVAKPNWEDGLLREDLPTKTDHSVVCYLYRKIVAESEGELRVSLGAGDGLKVLLNGEEVLAVDAPREASPNQHVVTLNLTRGDNHLLVKLVTYNQRSGFYFALPDDPSVAPKKVLRIVAKPASARTPEQQREVRKFYRENACELQQLVQRREEQRGLRVELVELEASTPTTLVYREMQQPRPAFVLERGEYNQPGSPVSRDTPSFLPPMPPELPRNRLGLAEWLTSDQNPLTARVFVNRVWQQLFGVGLVNTAGDFGAQGGLPSHPELLDWLADDFVRGGWDVRRLVEQIVLSQAFRQSSVAGAASRQGDPAGRLLSRFPRRRLDAETLRDQALAVSGLLATQRGGPSVRPPQPAGLWEAVGYTRSNTAVFRADADPAATHRRTLYTFIKRTAVAPQLSTFDAPTRESCAVQRERTNTPLQALLLLNDPQYLEAAVALARRAGADVGADEASDGRSDPRESIAWMFEACLCRPPTPEECASLADCYATERARFDRRPAEADALLAIGGSAAGAGPDAYAPHHAALALVANVVLNLDEFVNQN
ncbi:Planctomycete cytochrome C [Pirellulimonas nuda]|uniref:Planctomycete cytochrome C n=2 Tax=Pirellulimonas nuda TaxID=2528009 RepID=A0A518DEW1_9BACT|nr:Planctomycete cytochrome C [Pirellulimonas nuda]